MDRQKVKSGLGLMFWGNIVALFAVIPILGGIAVLVGGIMELIAIVNLRKQSEKYNNALSDRRAKSTRDWLIKAGIDASRLTAKGYGESQLVNHCADGVKCSELEHQANRRSEFVILSIE